MAEILWWGYRHVNGNVQVKRWWGPRLSSGAIDDARRSPFVESVTDAPFAAASRTEALRIAHGIFVGRGF